MGAPRTAGSVQAQPRPGSLPRVLVVDDDAAVQRLLRMVLEHQGYVVDCAANGREALDKIDGDPPGLVVLDLMMPVMDGWEVLNRLRRRARRPPVIVVSAATDSADALDKGAVAVVRKPFSHASLLDACAQALGKQP